MAAKIFIFSTVYLTGSGSFFLKSGFLFQDFDFRRNYYMTLTFNPHYNDLRAGAFYATALDYLKQTAIWILKGIYQVMQHYFLSPAPNAVYLLKPAEPVIGFKLLRHSLFLRHLPYKPVHHFITFFIDFRKMLP